MALKLTNWIKCTLEISLGSKRIGLSKSQYEDYITTMQSRAVEVKPGGSDDSLVYAPTACMNPSDPLFDPDTFMSLNQFTRDNQVLANLLLTWYEGASLQSTAKGVADLRSALNSKINHHGSILHHFHTRIIELNRHAVSEEVLTLLDQLAELSFSIDAGNDAPI